MYCVIGQKILRCEVSEKLENYSWVRIGKVEKGQTIPNNRIFDTEEAAKRFIQKRDSHKASMDKDLMDEVTACKCLYDAFFEETGIMVRVIDRLFKINDVEKQLAHLRKKYSKSDDSNQTGKPVAKDSRQYSTKPSSSFKSKKDNDEDTDYNYKFKDKKAPKNDRRLGKRQDTSSDYKSADKKKHKSDRRSNDRQASKAEHLFSDKSNAKPERKFGGNQSAKSDRKFSGNHPSQSDRKFGGSQSSQSDRKFGGSQSSQSDRKFSGRGPQHKSSGKPATRTYK